MIRLHRAYAVATALLIFFASASAVSAQTAPKIGVFDPQRVSEETAEGKRIQAQLGSIREQRQKEIFDEESKIAELQQQLEQQRLSLSADRRATLEIDIQRRLLELQSRKDMATRGFQLEISAAEARFNEKLGAVIGQFARDEGFSIIFEAAAVAYASSGVDVTTAIIEQFDKLYPPQTE